MTDGALTVRSARPEDAEWIASMNARMARETESRELDRERLLGGVQAVFADPARGRYFVAERDEGIAGCLLVTREWSDWRCGWFWWIQSVYVEPDKRGGGVFRAMYGELERSAREAGDVCGLRLYVERENEKAQAVYQRMGMSRTDYHLYELDYVLGASE